MGSFYSTTCKTDCPQILYTCWKNWISVPNIVHRLTQTLRCNNWKIQHRGDSQDAINSIRRSANDGERATAKPITSFVIRLEAVRGSSNVPIEGHFWRFLGSLNPKMLSAIVWTPKRHFLTSQRVFWAILRWNPCTGHFSKRVREKKFKIKKRGLILHVFRQALAYGRLSHILGYVFVSWT